MIEPSHNACRKDVGIARIMAMMKMKEGIDRSSKEIEGSLSGAKQTFLIRGLLIRMYGYTGAIRFGL